MAVAVREMAASLPDSLRDLSVSVIVAQVRSTAVDLIRGWGLGREEAERLVREATSRLATDEHALPTHSSPRGS